MQSGHSGGTCAETIKKVGEDIEGLKFNVAIAQMMQCVNVYTSAAEIPLDLFRSQCTTSAWQM